MMQTDAEIISALRSENAQLRREVATLTTILELTDARLARLAVHAQSSLDVLTGVAKTLGVAV